MTTGMSTTLANSVLDSYTGRTTWTKPAALYVKLHTGDPGSAGSTTPATNATRTLATFSAAANGSTTTTADVTWTSVSTTETYSHVSFWDASTSGNYLGSDALETARAVTAGDNFTIATGDLDLSITPIAA